MIAALIAVSFVVFCAFVGRGVQSCFLRNCEPFSTRDYCVAPAIGLSALILPTVWLNFAGLPVHSFGRALCIVLVMLASIAFVRMRRWPSLGSFALLLLISILSIAVVARPMIEYGFNWLAFANDDMANYCLSAERLLLHGFFEIPSRGAFVAGSDTSQYYWILEAAGNARAGVDELLAVAGAVTGLAPSAVFMSLSVALNVILILACGAIAAQKPRDLATAVVAIVAAFCSSLVTLGVLYQLLAQVAGLALLVSAMAYAKDLLESRRLYSLASFAMLSTALTMAYPEVLPFLILSIGLLFAIELYGGRIRIRSASVNVVYASIAVAVLLNLYWRQALGAIIVQTSGAGAYASPLFWYYLVPSGPANLFGILPIAAPADQDTTSYLSIVGFCLLGALVVATLGRAREGLSSDVVVLVMALLGAYLFYRGSGFGLFKLAMYIQPFLWATVAVFVSRILGLDLFKEAKP